MRAFARRSLLAVSLLASSAGPLASASAQGIYLPQAPTGPGGEDTIETASGARCRQSINSNGAYLDVGVTAHASGGQSPYAGLFPRTDSGGQDATGYARITVPIGRRPTRLDCSRLYEMELARMKREIELLEMAAE